MVLLQPSDCSNTRAGCNWVELGIGAKTAAGEISYCCSSEAVDLGLCVASSVGRMILETEKFSGHHLMVNIPADTDYDAYGFHKFGLFEEKESSSSGKYAVVFANCNDYGRAVMIQGETEWKSHFGYLPGELFVPCTSLHFSLCFT